MRTQGEAAISRSPTADRRLEDRRYPAVDELDRSRRELAADRFHPGLDFTSTNRADRSQTERWVRVQPQIGLRLRRSARPVDLSCSPRLGVVAKQRARPRRVDVEAVGEAPRTPSRNCWASPLRSKWRVFCGPPGYSRHLVRYRPLGLLSMLATAPPLTARGPISVLKKSSALRTTAVRNKETVGRGA